MQRFSNLHRLWVSLLILIIPSVTHAQQYMKQLDATDAQFETWVNTGKLTKCHATAPARYPEGPKEALKDAAKVSGACYVDIDRAAAISPPPLVVHAGTRVFVRIEHPRENESLLPAVAFSKLVPPSPGVDILKNAVNPLQAITLSPVVGGAQPLFLATLPPCDPSDRELFSPAGCQAYLVNQINSTQASVNHANAALACLESYQIVNESPAAEPFKPAPSIKSYSCSPAQPIKPDSFSQQKANVINIINDATSLTLPTSAFSQLDVELLKKPVDNSALLSKDAEIKAAMTAIQGAQVTLQQSYVLLQSLPNTSSNRIYYFDVPRLTTATATITGIELVSKTSSNIATWTTSSTSYDVVFSAGLGFSNLVYRTSFPSKLAA
jgi:hypothetical protein